MAIALLLQCVSSVTIDKNDVLKSDLFTRINTELDNITWVYMSQVRKLTCHLITHEYISMGILEQKAIDIVRFILHQTLGKTKPQSNQYTIS